MTGFDIVSPETIESGDATDAYFDRTVETLEGADRNPTVVADVTASQFPTGDWQVFAGLKDAAHLLAGRDIDAEALPEGQLFDGGPVMRIEGPYLEFCRLETSLLGFLSHPTGMATAALAARRAAPETTVLSFGARHLHPAVTATLERSALIGGFDGISHVAAGDQLDREATGTMPHALIICFGPGNQERAWQAFDEGVGPDVSRIALCDTYSDEIEESLRAIETVENLDGVRIDTTGSRRGDFAHILRELRWKLDARGHEDVDIFASGGITPETMRAVREYVDGFGVGSSVSDADPVDFSLDIIEVEGESAVKRGKVGDRRAVYRTPKGEHELAHPDEAVAGDQLLEPLIRDGNLVREFDIDDAAARASEDADHVGFGET
jgi:nicotinate phosphoribosyltransferase